MEPCLSHTLVGTCVCVCVCVIRTGPVGKWEKDKQSREEWFAHYFPPAAFQRLFGTDAGPTNLESNAMFATRKVSMCPSFIISTNDSFLPELIELLKTMPTRVIMIRVEDFGRTVYEGCGVDRVANLHGAEYKYGRPAIVIDGGTAMTWTTTDSKTGNIRGGGIAPGLAMKFRALNAFTDKLPDLDFQVVMERVEQCAQTKKALKLYADNTKDAMITAILRETTLLLAHVVRIWVKECLGQGRRTTSVPICFTGGDAALLQKLLTKDRGNILQKREDGLNIPQEAKTSVEKNIIHEGIGALLLEKTMGTKEMSNEELARNNCIGQRVALEKDSKLLRGTIVDVTRGTLLKEDKFTVSLEDYTDSTLDPTELCGKFAVASRCRRARNCSLTSDFFLAALNLYAEKGEKEEVEARIAILLEKVEQQKGLLQAPMAKKGRAKRAAEWMTALLEGKPFEPPDDLQNGTVPGRESELAQKRNALTEAGASAKKKARTEFGIDRESILKSPKAYVGRRVAKFFDGDGLFFGTINKLKPSKLDTADEITLLWKVVYDDEDKEEYDVDDMVEYLKLYEANAEKDPNPK